MGVFLDCALNWLRGGPTLCPNTAGPRSGTCAGSKAHIREAPMLTWSRILAAALPFLIVVAFVSSPAAPQAAALSGQVTSPEEGAMEGVVVSAGRQASNTRVSVFTNAEGGYSSRPVVSKRASTRSQPARSDTTSMARRPRP